MRVVRWKIEMNIENCTQEDFLQIRNDIVEFWGNDRTLHLHHPVFLWEFGDTAFVVRDGTCVVAYLFGFISQTHPVGYIHLVAVRNSHKRQGLAGRLYDHFARIAEVRSCTALKAVTTPANRASIAFHKALGFRLEGSPNADGVPVVRDYSGKGNDRVVFTKPLCAGKGDEMPGGQIDLVIRDARADDALGVVAVLNPIIESGAPVAFDAPITEEAERRYIAGFPQRGVFHVAVRTDDGAIVGFQSMEPFATYTHAFDHVGVIATYVDIACRRRGVASRLFAATFAAARRKGYEKIFTYIRADNPTALAAYAKLGFRVVGRAERHVRIGGQYIDEIMVERFL